MDKLLKSSYNIRFGDCDMFGHLHHSRYLDYFINAREDHLKEYYDLSLLDFYQKGMSWLVGGHEIVYLKPAFYNEQVVIHSSLIRAMREYLLVEMTMWDKSETQLKSAVWSKFVNFSTKTGEPEQHSADFMNFAKEIEVHDISTDAGLKNRITEILNILRNRPQLV